MANTIFLLLEGRHDAAFMARLLKLQGFTQRKKLSAIPAQFGKLFPSDYPATEDTPLTEPHPVPVFYQNDERWLVMLIGGGSKSALTLGTTLKRARIAGFIPDSIGVVIDQDQDTDPETSRDRFLVEFKKEEDLPIPLDFNIAPGTVIEGPPRRGLFVLPDNMSAGALEDILLACGEVNYKALKDRAMAFRDDALTNCHLSADDLKDYGPGGGQQDISKRKKAWVAAMGSILVPAAAIQNSIRRNRWVEGGSLDLPQVKAIAEFLDKLIA